MKNLPYLTLLVIMLLAVASHLSAAEERGSGKHGEHKEHRMAAMEEDSMLKIGNKICPVSGEPVDEMGGPVKVEYNGKIYNLCCKMCKKDFEKNPEKYMAIAEAGAHETGNSSDRDADSHAQGVQSDN